MNILIATGNAHKREEIAAILEGTACELDDLRSFPEIPEVVEDGDTFDANARKKAVTVALAVKRWVLADDSGLEVDALNGEPGIFSARYAGEPPDYLANNRKLLSELDGNSHRRARFRCVIAWSDPWGHAWTVEGACEGEIIESPRGDSGFGYDPLFLPAGNDRTFAEMPAALKNRISHRGVALRNLQRILPLFFRLALPEYREG